MQNEIVMTPEHAIETMLAWLPAIVIGAWLLRYVFDLIRDIFTEKD